MGTDYASQCGGKERFETKEGAFGEIRNRIRRGLPSGGLVPYRCPHCGHWHIGHPFGWVKRREADRRRRRLRAEGEG
jgi:hypothetical protein